MLDTSIIILCLNRSAVVGLFNKTADANKFSLENLISYISHHMFCFSRVEIFFKRVMEAMGVVAAMVLVRSV